MATLGTEIRSDFVSFAAQTIGTNPGDSFRFRGRSFPATIGTERRFYFLFRFSFLSFFVTFRAHPLGDLCPVFGTLRPAALRAIFVVFGDILPATNFAFPGFRL
jgi:hypothetical protein